MSRFVLAIFALAGCQGMAPGADPEVPADVSSLQQAAGSGTTGTQSVKVVNTASDWAAPVPTAQSGSWTVNAVQSGPWNMSLQPGGVISIGNSPTVALQPGTAVNVGTVLNAISVASLPDVNVASLPPVTVANLPATQAVTGSVSVSNFPATQTVGGTVAVANLPATQTVNGSVTATQGGSWSVGITNTPTVHVAPAGLTHLGQPASALVTVQASPDAVDPFSMPLALTRLDLTGGGSPFSVPPGMVLVITEVDWSTLSLADAGKRAWLSLLVGTPVKNAVNWTGFTHFDQDGWAAENSTIRAGIRVGENEGILGYVLAGSNTVLPPTNITLRGYLVALAP